MCANRKRSGRISSLMLFGLFATLLLGMSIDTVSHAITLEIGSSSVSPEGHAVCSLIQVSMNPKSIVWPKDHTNINEYEIFRNTQLVLMKSPYVLITALRKQDIANLSIVKQESDPLSWLENNLKVEYVKNSEIMRVSLTSKNPKESAKLVNAVVAAYFEGVVKRQERERHAKFAQLAQIYNSKENEVRNKRATLIRLSEKLSIANSDTAKIQQTINIQELHELRSALLRMQMNLGEAQGALKAGQARLKRLDETPVSETEAQKLIKNTKRAEVEEKIASAQVQVMILTERVKELAIKVAVQKEKVSEIGRSSVDIEIMSAELEVLKKVLAEIGYKREKLAIESRARPRMTLLTKAYPRSK